MGETAEILEEKMRQKKQEEEELLARYHAEDTAQPARAPGPEPGAVGLPASGGRA